MIRERIGLGGQPGPAVFDDDAVDRAEGLALHVVERRDVEPERPSALDLLHDRDA